MLHSSSNSTGERGVIGLPANRSIVIADSRFRVSDSESPYDFECLLGGSGLYAKELFYAKLYWCQPLFAHNKTNCELIFQVCNDTTKTYCVYATPFLMYNEYDGNDAETTSPLSTPKSYSYADNMEQAFNGDVRNYYSNLTPVNGSGIVLDPAGYPLSIRFRYSASRGFVIYPVLDANSNYGLVPTIRLLPCNYISKAHFVHGFGVWSNKTINSISGVYSNDYIPRSDWVTSYWSDCTPNLIPFRYIVIRSDELNKDRRLISFQNGRSSKFANELTIISLNPENNGSFHVDATGEDATVVSLRDEYTPQMFRISIAKEDGSILKCDDPISQLLGDPSVSGTTKNSFLSTGSNPNRGNYNFTNSLLFGNNVVISHNGGKIVWQNELIIPSVTVSAGYKNGFINASQTDYNYLNVAGLPPSSYYCPFALAQPVNVYDEEYNVCLTYEQTVPSTILMEMIYPSPYPTVIVNCSIFRWNSFAVPQFRLFLDGLINTAVGFGANKQFSLIVSMYDANYLLGLPHTVFSWMPSIVSPGTAIWAWRVYDSPPNNTSDTIQFNTGWDFENGIQPEISYAWTNTNPSTLYPDITNIPVVFVFTWINRSLAGLDPPGIARAAWIGPGTSSNGQHVLGFGWDRVIDEPIHRPFVTDNYGDPEADGLCSEVIHEITTLLEYN